MYSAITRINQYTLQSIILSVSDLMDMLWPITETDEEIIGRCISDKLANNEATGLELTRENGYQMVNDWLIINFLSKMICSL